jgi:hypothetical protein
MSERTWLTQGSTMQVGHVDRAAWIMARVHRRYGHRRAPEKELQDRQIVRRQIPQDVDVRLEEPQVDPHRVDVEQVAEAAGRHLPADFLDGAGEQEGVIDEDLPPQARRQREQRFAFLDRGRERLFDEHVASGLEAAPGHLEMARHGNRDGDEVRPRIEKGAQVRGRGRRRIMGRGLLQAVGVEIAQAHQPKVVARREVPSQIGSPVPEAHDRGTQLRRFSRHRHSVAPPRRSRTSHRSRESGTQKVRPVPTRPSG